MKFANKEFSDYWKIIKVPTYILIAWSILGFIISIISFSLYATIFSPLAGIILIIAVFAFVGWTSVKDHKQGIKISAWAGALSGAIYAFIGGIVGILMIYFVPDVLFFQAAQAGVDVASIEGTVKIFSFVGLIINPLFFGLIGAGVSAIAALIAKKI